MASACRILIYFSFDTTVRLSAATLLSCLSVLNELSAFYYRAPQIKIKGVQASPTKSIGQEKTPVKIRAVKIATMPSTLAERPSVPIPFKS